MSKVELIEQLVDGTLIKHWVDQEGITRKQLFYDGSQYYYDGYSGRHREDGPAVDDPANSRIEWHWHGKKLDCKTQEEFERLIKLAVFW